MTTIMDTITQNMRNAYDDYSAAVKKQDAEIDEDDVWDFNHMLVELTYAKCRMFDVIFYVGDFLEFNGGMTEEDINWVKKTLHEMVEELV